MRDDDLLETATAVRRGATRLSRRLRLERPEHGEPLLRVSVLGHLYRRGPTSPGELAAAERIQPQSLTRTLAALESAHLVTRRADPADGRRSQLAITAEGRAALLYDMQQCDSWLAGAMADQLTGTEQELLRLAGELMERLAEAEVSAHRTPGRSQSSCRSSDLPFHDRE